MSLHKYHQKRKFQKTPEPKGKPLKTTGPLTFVIQKHQASQLHYDFRLELDGVLKSWAVPKGPSLDSEEKRLAMHVEDHPLDYAQFEGIIPKGNYGAGTVMVWDSGVYSPLDTVERKEAEEILSDQLKKGHLTFVLLGKKLKGEFALVKIQNSEDDAWLLIKKGDEYASKKDILKEDHSVLSQRSMSEIGQQAQKKQQVWYSRPKKLHLEGGIKGKMPRLVAPMLATLVDEPFNRPNWLFEMKLDGYRAIAEIESGQVKLYSRNNQPYNQKFALVADSLKKFPGNTVLDGEVVVVDKDGHPNFGWLQDYPNSKEGELIYYVFDILHFDGYNLEKLPLIKRKEILKSLLPPLPHVLYSDHIETEGIEFFKQASKLNLEGIMAKKGDSPYRRGIRSQDWLKIKTHLRQEAVIGGFTKGRGGRKHFGALVLGIYDKGKLRYIGHTGGGFDDKTLASIYQKLKPLEQDESPFETKPKTNAPVTWVKPKLICEVSFAAWTKDRQMRQPIFMGLREDKPAKEVKKEEAVDDVILGSGATPESDSGQATFPEGTRMTESWEQERVFSKDAPGIKEETQLQIGKRTLKISNLSKVFWPKEGYTKGDLVNYYREVAPFILPYLKNRPESLLRYPHSIEGAGFFQKDASNLKMDWVMRARIHSGLEKKNIEYLLCQDEASLIYLINLGCIDLNPWNSRIEHQEKPDYLIIDLDPEKVEFEKVVKVAQAAREVLESLGIESYPKTSGARGMHIYLPMGAKYNYEQVRYFAQLLCTHIQAKVPALTSMVRSPRERQGKVYLDFLQNARGQTLASAYSVRAKPGATVSTPLKWSEVTSKLHPSQFTIKNIPQRLKKEGDLFKGVLGKGVNMEKVLKKIGGSY